jgi:hypothetical protein
VSLLRGLTALDVSWTGLLTAAGFGLLVAMIPPVAGRKVVAAVAIVLLALLGFAAVAVAQDDVESFLEQERRTKVELSHASVDVPSTFERAEARQEVRGLPLPVEEGVVDTVALRGGTVVEIFTADPPSEDEGGGPALLSIDPGLQRELIVTEMALPDAFVAAYVEAGGDASTLRAFTLRRNGVEVAVTAERVMPDGSRIALVAAPPAGLHALPRLYASILARAQAHTQ